MALIVRSLATTYYDHYHIEPHAHAWGQLVYAASGVMRVCSGKSFWLVPPAQAVWVPAGVSHEIFARGTVAMRTLYFDPRVATSLPPDCRAIDVTPLLQAIVLHVVAMGMLDAKIPVQRRLAMTAIDQVAQASVSLFLLPLPSDSRAVRVADWLRENPGSNAELKVLASTAAASDRTIQRLFLQETGLRFSEWRQRLRLIHAAGLIGMGASVTEAGFEVGYASTSAFIAAFRARFGCTPAATRREFQFDAARASRHQTGLNRNRDRSRAFSASVCRSRGLAWVDSDFINTRAAAATSSTAWVNAASLTFDGVLKPLNLRTNCNDAARISCSVAGGSKLNSVLMFLHMRFLDGKSSVCGVQTARLPTARWPLDTSASL